MCISGDADRVPWPKPAGYKKEDFLLMQRALDAAGTTQVRTMLLALLLLALLLLLLVLVLLLLLLQALLILLLLLTRRAPLSSLCPDRDCLVSSCSRDLRPYTLASLSVVCCSLCRQLCADGRCVMVMQATLGRRRSSATAAGSTSQLPISRP